MSVPLVKTDTELICYFVGEEAKWPLIRDRAICRETDHTGEEEWAAFIKGDPGGECIDKAHGMHTVCSRYYLPTE